MSQRHQSLHTRKPVLRIRGLGIAQTTLELETKEPKMLAITADITVFEQFQFPTPTRR